MNVTKKKITLSLALFAATLLLFLLLFVTMSQSINVYDEGLVLTGALRVLHGDYPHLDFYANYGPGTFYILAGLFKLFGKYLITERIFDLIIRTLIILAVFFITKKYCKKSTAITTAIACTFYLAGLDFYGYPAFPALLFGITSIPLLVSSYQKENNLYLTLSAGLLSGIAAIFRYDIGFFSYLSLCLSTCLIYLFSLRHDIHIPKSTWRRLLSLSIGAATPVLIILALHQHKNALDDFLHDVIIFPSENYAATRGLPFPGLSALLRKRGIINIAVYVPILTLALTLMYFLSPNPPTAEQKHRKEPASIRLNKQLFIIAISSLTLCFYLKGLVRVSVLHMIISIIPSMMLLAVLQEGIKEKKKTLKLLSSLAITLIAISSSYLMYKKVRSDTILKHLTNYHAEASTPHPEKNEKSESYLFTTDEDRAEAISYLRDKVTPYGFFYSGLGRHDKIFVNDNASYFLLNTQPATKWHHFDPGLQNSLIIQEKIIKELKDKRPQYIMLDSSWDDEKEPNKSAESSEVFLLDEFIHSTYSPVRVFGKITILKLKD